MPARLYLVFKSPETVYYERVNQPFRFSVHVNLARCILELPTLGFLTNLRGSQLFSKIWYRALYHASNGLVVMEIHSCFVRPKPYALSVSKVFSLACDKHFPLIIRMGTQLLHIFVTLKNSKHWQIWHIRCGIDMCFPWRVTTHCIGN